MRFEKSYGNWLPDGPNSEILSHSVRYDIMGSSYDLSRKIQCTVCLNLLIFILLCSAHDLCSILKHGCAEPFDAEITCVMHLLFSSNFGLTYGIGALAETWAKLTRASNWAMMSFIINIGST